MVASTWASEHPLGLFGPMLDILPAIGIDEPYPQAFTRQSGTLSAIELHELLTAAGLQEIVVETVTLDAVWPNVGDALSTVLATPFRPAVLALPPDRQVQMRDCFARGLGHSPDGTVTVRTTSHVGCGTK